MLMVITTMMTVESGNLNIKRCFSSLGPTMDLIILYDTFVLIYIVDTLLLYSK